MRSDPGLIDGTPPSRRLVSCNLGRVTPPGEAPQIDAVVFDIGRVLLDWNPQYLFGGLIPDEAERHRFLTEVCSPAWNAAQDAGRSWAEGVAEATSRFPEYAGLIAAYDERWEETITGPLDGTVAVLEELRAQGVSTYALTNFSAEKWLVAQRRWPFLALFDGAVVSGRERVTKPDRRIFSILLDRYRLDPSRTFFTDDMAVNVEAARAMGIRAEQFVDAGTLRRRLVALGVLDGSPGDV